MFDHFFDLDIPGEVISSLIVVLIIVILSIIIAIKAHFQDPLKKPKGLLLITEIGVNYFDGFVKDLTGSALPNFGGFIMGVACYLFLAFIFGLTGLPSPVTYMAVPLSLGLTTFLLIHLISVKYTKWGYFKRYIDPMPVFLPVNLLSMWAPLLSLTLRLFGNAVAGWALLTIVERGLGKISATIFTFMPTTTPTVFNAGGDPMNWNKIFLAPIPLAALHAYFDLFSGLIQTMVFISLTAIFIGQEIPEEAMINNLQERRSNS